MAKAAKPKDPTKVPVKRERSEVYALVSALEIAKKKRAKLVKRLAVVGGLQALLAEQDSEIARLGKRLTEVMASEPAAGE